MARIRFPRKTIEKEITLDEKGQELIHRFGVVIENLDEREIEVEILANRPDLLSAQGFMRALKSYQGKETGLKKYQIKKLAKNPYMLKVNSLVKEVRPYTVCAVVKDLSLDEDTLKELIALQEKLHLTLGRNRKRCALGIYPLDKIAFPISYTAKKPEEIVFTPLGSQKEMNAAQILQKHPMGKQYADLLKRYTRYPVFIDAAGKILSMPPIINSEYTGRVSLETRDLFIECSGHDLETLQTALNIVVTTCAEMGGAIYSVAIDDQKKLTTPDLTPQETSFKKENAEKLLGISISETEAKKLLARMGHEYNGKKVTSPAWRNDILHEVDLIEDLAIAYGYHNLAPEMPQIATIGQELDSEKKKRALMESLVGLSFVEASSLHFITLEESERQMLEKPILVENARTEFTILRSDLVTPMLRNFSRNTDAEYPQKLAEIGTVFINDSNEPLEVREEARLCLGVSPSNFTALKQILDYLTQFLNIAVSLKETKAHGFITGRTAEIMLDNKSIGIVGEIHPSLLAEWKIKMPLSILEINLDKLIA